MLHDRIVGCLDITDADVLLQFLVREKDHGTLAIIVDCDTWCHWPSHFWRFLVHGGPTWT